jgi:hypothetical protein
VDDPQNVEDAILDDHVVHDAVVADAQTMERVGSSLDRPHPFAAYAAGSGSGRCKLLEAALDPRAHWIGKLAIRARRRRREQNLERRRFAQPGSRSGWERPLRYASRALRRIRTNSSALASTRSSASSIGTITAAGRPRFVTT